MNGTALVLGVDGDTSDIFEEHYKQISCRYLFINIQFCGTSVVVCSVCDV